MRSALRALGSTVALVTIYYLLPFDRTSTGAAATILVIGLLLLVGLVASWVILGPAFEQRIEGMEIVAVERIDEALNHLRG